MTQGGGGRARGESDVDNIDGPGDAIGSVVGGAAGGGGGERATGTPNAVYDLSSVLFHALQGGASHDAYIEDAQREGDEELTEFFRRVREEDRDRAAEARMLLAERTPTASRTEGPTAGVSPGTEQVGSFPAGGDARPASAEAAASPRPEPSDDFPGTEPVEGEGPTARAGEVPTAEGVPAPRTEGVPGAEEVPSGAPPQAPPGDVQRETSWAEARSRGENKRLRGGRKGRRRSPRGRRRKRWPGGRGRGIGGKRTRACWTRSRTASSARGAGGRRARSTGAKVIRAVGR